MVNKYSKISYWLYALPLIYINFTIFRINLVFLNVSIIDMKRRWISMIICETNLEPNRFKVKEMFKGPPLINYFDPRTLLSWIDARVMFLDMG